MNPEKIRQKEKLAKLKARTKILDKIKKSDYLVDAKVDAVKDDMKLLIKKLPVKEVPAVAKRDRESQQDLK